MDVRRAYLVRHSRAVLRNDWDRWNSLRPLTPAGWRQSADLARTLGTRVERVVSSPAVRCVDTVVPLARTLGVRITLSPALREGARAAGALALMRRMRTDAAAFCTHGDVIEGVLDLLEEEGVRLPGGARLAKGSAWRLSLDAEGTVVRAAYIPPGS